MAFAVAGEFPHPRRSDCDHRSLRDLLRQRVEAFAMYQARAAHPRQAGRRRTGRSAID